MYRRWVVAALAPLVMLACWPAAVWAKQGTHDDPKDNPSGTAPDIRRLFHEDDASQVIFWMESYNNFLEGQGPSCTWRLEFDGDRDPEMLVLHGRSAQRDPAQQITFRSNGPDKIVLLNSHRKMPSSSTSSANNTIRVPVPRAEMTKRGLKSTTYRYTADCAYAGSTTGTDYVPDNRMPTITHTIGGAATPAPATPKATVAPTPTAKPTAKPTPKPTTARATAAPEATATPLAAGEAADDDDMNTPLAIAAIIAVLLGIGFVFAFWRRRRDEEDSAQRA